MVMSCALVFLVNMKLIDIHAISIGIPNFGVLLAELAILFCILTISKKIWPGWFFLSALLLGLMTFSLESVRNSTDGKLVILFNACLLTVLFVSSYIVCKIHLVPAVKNNGFMRLFAWFELGLVGYGLLRVMGSFLGAPIIPREEPAIIAIFIYALFLVLGTFRYLSYIGFLMTWVDSNNPSVNFLNRPLAKAIEEKNQFLRGLIASNRIIGISALASSLAHQLSQPLTTISVRAATTRRNLMEVKDNSISIASLDDISIQSAKLSQLVHNLRKLFSNKNDHFSVVKLQQVCDEVLELIKPTLESKNINLELEYQVDSEVWGDSIQLQQVIINVLNNAIDAIDAAGGNKQNRREIKLGLYEESGFASLEVIDSGSGIQPMILEAIFELYTTNKENGLGVGLWLCKTIIERHMGTISASNSANGGAKLKITIPLHT